jgi:phosphoribosylanthranilate isomerase
MFLPHVKICGITGKPDAVLCAEDRRRRARRGFY